MKNLLAFALLALTLTATAQKADKKLEKKLTEAIEGFNGTVGLYVKNLRTGKIVAINADTIFPTASIVKIPILLGIMKKIDEGSLKFDDKFQYKDSLLYEGVDILGSFKQDEKITLKKLIMLMMTTSDNTASLWLQSIAGTGTRINEITDSLGLHQTRVNSRTPGREEYRSINGWGQTTPNDMGRFMEMLHHSKIFSPYASEQIMRQMGRNLWDVSEAISMIPPYIEVFSKNGCVNAVRSEVLLVNAPNNPYIFCIFTKNNGDRSWTHENEAWTLARKLSSLLWDYFEPKDTWVKPSVPNAN